MRINIVSISGGLGNQMFQYAFYLHLKKQIFRKSTNLIFISGYKGHNGYELDKVFGVKHHKLLNLTLGFIKRYLKPIVFRYYEENPATFKNISKFNFPKPVIYFAGYWQTEKYFNDIKPVIKNTFTFNGSLASDKTNKMIAEMKQVEAVSIHIRRGDYETDPVVKHVHGGICDLTYYQAAIKLMERKVPDPFYYVFTDDLEWVEKNFRLNAMVIVDWNRAGDSWQDMLMMSFCKHNVIANSSFSWWGAWLNSNPDKIIISPQNWFNEIELPDIHPQTWIKI